jgi:asparagine synthase (glutamine-hydrolysing)
LLDSAVKAQLRSDVPVGVLLSGGFDSGMIVASASRAGVPLHTYSVGFDDGVQASELSVARDMAARYGSTHHERVIKCSEIVEFLDSALGSMSEPVADSSIVPTYCLSSMAADDGVKVLLSGAGGDEVFAGYSRYVASSLQRKLLFSLPRAIRTTLGRTLFANSLFGARLRHPAMDMLVYAGGSPSLARRFFKDASDFRNFLDRLVEGVFPTPIYEQKPLYEHMSFDLQVYLPDLLLMTLDQLTMAHTIEGRVPLLDIDLIKASYSLDPELHASPTQSTTRRLMRAMAIGRVDPRTFTSSKLGFSGPVRHWIAHNSAIFQEVVMAAREIPELRGWPIEELWKSGEAGQDSAWAKDMFTIYCFSRWYHSHG